MRKMPSAVAAIMPPATPMLYLLVRRNISRKEPVATGGHEGDLHHTGPLTGDEKPAGGKDEDR